MASSDTYSEPQNEEDDCPQPAAKKRKTLVCDNSSECKNTKGNYSGAAIYKTKFQSCWTKEWPFIERVPDDQYAFRCTICHRMFHVHIKVNEMSPDILTRPSMQRMSKH